MTSSVPTYTPCNHAAKVSTVIASLEMMLSCDSVESAQTLNLDNEAARAFPNDAFEGWDYDDSHLEREGNGA